MLPIHADGDFCAINYATDGRTVQVLAWRNNSDWRGGAAISAAGSLIAVTSGGMVPVSALLRLRS